MVNTLKLVHKLPSEFSNFSIVKIDEEDQLPKFYAKHENSQKNQYFTINEIICDNKNEKNPQITQISENWNKKLYKYKPTRKDPMNVAYFYSTFIQRQNGSQWYDEIEKIETDLRNLCDKAREKDNNKPLVLTDNQKQVQGLIDYDDNKQYNLKELLDIAKNHRINKIYAYRFRENDIYREKDNLNYIRNHANQLVEKGIWKKERKGKEIVYSLSNTSDKSSTQKDFPSLLCDIQNIIENDNKYFGKKGDFHYIRDFRDIAFNTFHIPKDEFDNKLRTELLSNIRNYDYGQGISSGLTKEDAISVSNSYTNMYIYYLRKDDC